MERGGRGGGGGAGVSAETDRQETDPELTGVQEY